MPKSGARKRELVRHLVDGQALELSRFIVRVTVDERRSRYVFVNRRCHGEILVRQGGTS